MANAEVDSFVTKLKHLWHSGYKASLNIEVCDGKASVTLAAEVGYALPPSSPVKGRGPSYRRRQERRRKAFDNNNEIKLEVNQAAEQAAFDEQYGRANEVTEQGADVLANDSALCDSGILNGSVDVHTEEVMVHQVENEDEVDELLKKAIAMSLEN